jgi:hypothetical protein
VHVSTLVKNKLARILGCGRGGVPILLMPGVNSVEKRDLDTLEANPHIRAAFERKDLEIISPRLEREPEPALLVRMGTEPEAEPVKAEVFDLTAVNVRDAGALVAETFDVALLRHWAEHDTRGTVKTAIERQIKRIMSDGDEEE